MDIAHSRVAKKEESFYHRYILESQETRKSLDLLLEIVNTCRGPNGRTKMIQNDSGGHVTITSSSKRLFAAIAVSKPINRMIVSAAQGHLNACSDGGLFVVSFCSLLVKHSLKLHTNRFTCVKLYEYFLQLCVKYLGNSCACKTRGRISDLNFLTAYVQSILVSKPLCWLHTSLAKLLIETFLFSIPDEFNAVDFLRTVHIVCLEDSSTSESELYKGLLLDAPEMSVFEEIELQCRLTNENCVKAVVVTASMSGDLEVLVDAKYEVDGNIDIEEEILKVLKLFCAYLIREHVGIVFCQKVIHPCLKLQLRGAGIIVLDRLGLQPANLTMEITGAVAVQSFVTPVPSVCFGKLATIRHIILKGKSYLLLTAEGKTVCTLLLCGRHEEAVQELKDVCSTALALLERLLHEHEPSVLMGAGCWQIHMASTLRKQVMSSREQLSETFGCTLSDVISACRTFSHCLELVGLSVSHDEEEHLIDNKYLHLWRVPKGEGDSLMEGTGGPQTCSCGLVKWNSKLKFYQILGNDSCVSECIGDDSSSGSFQEPSNWESLVVDSESVSINALKTAVLTACTVLQIRQYIENVN